MNLCFVSHNDKKNNEMKTFFKEKYATDIEIYCCELDEKEISDADVISREKAIQAYNLVNKPVFVIDSAFYIEVFGTFPGTLVRRANISEDLDFTLKLMQNIKNRNCCFVDCLTFFDGTEFYQFYGYSKGTLAYEPRGKLDEYSRSKLWQIFIPQNSTKTMAEMTYKERVERKDNHTSAKAQFMKWYTEEYQTNLKLNKKSKNF